MGWLGDTAAEIRAEMTGLATAAGLTILTIYGDQEILDANEKAEDDILDFMAQGNYGEIRSTDRDFRRLKIVDIILTHAYLSNNQKTRERGEKRLDQYAQAHPCGDSDIITAHGGKCFTSDDEHGDYGRAREASS